MHFASDNTSGAAPEVLAAVVAANAGYAPSYGAEPAMLRVRDRLRTLFEAPEAEVLLLSTGTSANSLALALGCPPWGAVFCHEAAHVAQDECGAPEFYTHGAKLIGVPGAHGRMDPGALRDAIARTGAGGVHGVQRGMVTITNVTEAGTVLTPAEVAALAAEGRAAGLPVHLDGARLPQALAATGASPADMTHRAGITHLTLGATKTGCLGVEALILFDPAARWEGELRRKRAGHLASKHRFLSAQMEGWLADGLWLRLAAQANARGAELAAGLAARPGVRLTHPVEANMIFAEWPAGTAERLRAAGAALYSWPLEPGREGARLVASWCTTGAEVAAVLAALDAAL
jgi:threonine aldolase